MKAAHEVIDRFLAPDGRRGISRMVEDVQAAYLFGAFPPNSQSPDAIEQAVKEKLEDVSQLAETWLTFMTRGKRFYGQATYQKTFLDCYMAYYCPVNVPKIQAVLTELLRKGEWKPGTGGLRVIDLGTGPGTTFLALADWLLLYRAAAGPDQFPASLHLSGVDRSPAALEATHRTAGLVAAAVQRWIDQRLAIIGDSQREGFDAWERVAAACKSPTLTRADLAEPPSPALIDAVEAADLIVASYVLNEVRDEGQTTEHLERLLDSAKPGALVLVLEPGDRRDASGLMEWRRAFLRQRRDWETIGPCGEPFGNELPASCHDCWPLSREPLLAKPLYAAFVERLPDGATRPIDDRAGFLSWSYTVLRRTEGRTSRVQRHLQRNAGDHEAAVIARIPLPNAGDASDAPNGAQRADAEFVKVCPAEVGAASEATLRLSSENVPDGLAVGRRIRFSGFERRTDEKGSVWFSPRPGWRLAPADALRSPGSQVETRVDRAGVDWLSYVSSGSVRTV
ncbi:MAG: hypothetical protein KatS3mg064_0817 [Tepidiforma sp.]|nr:methyltransferase domain-containing protein [Tepidiforma sp.]GIW17660.1 MAG: hypothetical protein KatS3mg064_0817 [Tepidiforma sp.]